MAPTVNVCPVNVSRAPSYRAWNPNAASPIVKNHSPALRLSAERVGSTEESLGNSSCSEPAWKSPLIKEKEAASCLQNEPQDPGLSLSATTSEKHKKDKGVKLPRPAYNRLNSGLFISRHNFSSMI